jgi:hypothetical protein
MIASKEAVMIFVFMSVHLPSFNSSTIKANKPIEHKNPTKKIGREISLGKVNLIFISPILFGNSAIIALQP